MVDIFGLFSIACIKQTVVSSLMLNYNQIQIVSLIDRLSIEYLNIRLRNDYDEIITNLLLNRLQSTMRRGLKLMDCQRSSSIFPMLF